MISNMLKNDRNNNVLDLKAHRSSGHIVIPGAPREKVDLPSPATSESHVISAALYRLTAGTPHPPASSVSSAAPRG